MPATKSSPLYAVWEWTQTALLAGNLAWTTLCLGGYRAETVVVTSAVTAALLLVHALGWLMISARKVPSGALESIAKYEPALSEEARGSFLPTLHPAGLLFLPFLIYAAANVIWVTPVHWLGWFDFFNWTEMFAVFWVVLNGIRTRRAQRALVRAILAVAFVSVLLGCYQRFVDPHWLPLHRHQIDQYAGRVSGSFGIPNSLAALLLLLLPLTGVLAVRRSASTNARIFFGWLTLVFAFGLVLTISRGAWLGLAIALTIWPLLVSRSSWRRRLALAGAVFGALLLVGVVVYAVSPKVHERVTQFVHDSGELSRPILWRACYKIFRVHPFVGSGGGSFDVVFEKYRPEGFLREPQWAHNEYLNTLSDYGAIGFGLFFGAAVVVVGKAVRTRRRFGDTTTLVRGVPTKPRNDVLDDPLVRQAMGIGLLAFALQLFVDFHFKMPALALAFATLAGLAVSRSWRCQVAENQRNRVGQVLTALIAIGATVLGFYFVPAYKAEALREPARERINLLVNEPVTSARYQQRIAEARTAFAVAVALTPNNAQAWADRAYGAAQWSLIKRDLELELGREAETYANHALELSSVCPEFWIRRGVARDMQDRWFDAGNDFTQAMMLSPNMVQPWYYYAYHLSLRRTEHDMAVAMVTFCLRLDPQNPESLRLRQQLATSRPGQ